jgi:hypothetical protein
LSIENRRLRVFILTYGGTRLPFKGRLPRFTGRGKPSEEGRCGTDANV